jgi:methylated-DNA-[protein]-cysteine S-methyltransferase
MEIITGYFLSPIGLIEIKAENDALVSLKFLDENPSFEENPSHDVLVAQAIRQLDEYFILKRKEFDIPVHYNGTEFQVKVWNELVKIPFGHTTTYGNIAMQLDSIKAVRAVGAANGKNPLPIIVPCHRVVGENKELVGYSGGLWRKQWLLEHESSEKQLTLDFL